MKKACSVCGAQQENEDVAADRNPSFLKKMATSSMSSLRLPLSFVRDQIDKLDSVVVLEGPSKGKWKVELQGCFQSFNLNFGQGWAKFVADHVLQIDDLLTFSLSTKSYFQVEVYDGGGCQKTSALDAEGAETVVAEAARPVQEARSVAEPERLVAEAKKAVEDFVEIAVIAMSVAEVVEAEKSIEDVAETASAVEEAAEAARSVEAEKSIENVAETASAVEEAAEAARSVEEVAEAARSEGLDDPDSGDGLIKLAKKDRGGHQLFKGNVISRRRVVTELETEQALQAAEVLELANPNILVVMSKQNVYNGFWLRIPKQFAKEWMPSQTKEVALVNKGGHSWPAKWIAGRGGFSGGWRRFSLDHCLEEHDVLVFELIDKENYVLLVHVFRVLGCPGEDPGLNTPALSRDQRFQRKPPNGREADCTPGGASERKSKRPYRDFLVDKHILEPESATKRFQSKSRLPGDSSTGAPGDAAAVRGGSGAPGFDTGVRAPEDISTAPQQVSAPISSGWERHEADGTPGEKSEGKWKLSRRDGQVDKHVLEPDSVQKSFKRKTRLLGEHKASPAKGKELTTPNHEELGTSDAELLIHLLQKTPVAQVSPTNRAYNGASHETALRSAGVAGPALGARGARDQDESNGAEGVTPVAPQQCLALVCFDNGKTVPGKEHSGTLHGAERPSSCARGEASPAYLNPDEVQKLYAPVTAKTPLGKKRKGHRRGAGRPSSARECGNPDDVQEQIPFAAATAVPFTGKKSEKRKEYKVVHIYSGRNVGTKTEYLTQLEGYSERRSLAPLERDEDTGFWWVPSEQFDWKMEHCYLG